MKNRNTIILALAAVVASSLVAAVAVPAAKAYDRQPVGVYGLKADTWGQSTTKAESQLKTRFPGIWHVECVGVKVNGYDTSWVSGLTRYWDKLQCVGNVYAHPGVFTLIEDSKGAYSWVIYRLHGATINEFKYGG